MNKMTHTTALHHISGHSEAQDKIRSFLYFPVDINTSRSILDPIPTKIKGFISPYHQQKVF
jgi:hypothetical protein